MRAVYLPIVVPPECRRTEGRVNGRSVFLEIDESLIQQRELARRAYLVPVKVGIGKNRCGSHCCEREVKGGV